MCLSSLLAQPPYNDKNALLFLSPKNLNSLNYQAILILEWITSALFHLQYHDWGETFEQDTEPPTVPRAPQQYGCPLLRVCVHSVYVHLDGLNAEHKFRVWVTKSGHTSLHFH